MMRINLLPPEILERRQAEKRIGYVVFAAFGIAAVLAIVWMFAFVRVQGKEGDLAALQQEVQIANTQAAQLAIFEERAAELETRRATVVQALGDRREWARLYDEISLVLPSDMWIQSLAAEEDAGIALNGYAVDPPGDTPDTGHKAIAKALVRLADLDALYDVWLTNSSKVDFEDQPAIQFTITAQVVAPTVPTGTTTTVSTSSTGTGGQ
jgi:Tfp pilus assembly protein PilN